MKDERCQCQTQTSPDYLFSSAELDKSLKCPQPYLFMVFLGQLAPELTYLLVKHGSTKVLHIQ
jgi:hypothetical protein